jgi:hypothetical protein
MVFVKSVFFYIRRGSIGLVGYGIRVDPPAYDKIGVMRLSRTGADQIWYY